MLIPEFRSNLRHIDNVDNLTLRAPTSSPSAPKREALGGDEGTTGMQRIFTLVHISDLHFGHLSLEPDAPLSAPSRRYWRLHPRFDGYLGHTHVALVHLQRRLFQLRESESARLIITGDVTACGHPDQFQLAKTFFLAKIPLSKKNHLGLEWDDSMDLSIPGNHDHWPGDGSILGDPSAGLVNMWPRMPYISQQFTLSKDTNLQILAINSDADVGSRSIHRFWARGLFDSQLRILDRLLDEQGPYPCLRILLVHHSRNHSTWDHTEIIDRESRRSLDEFLERHRIPIILTGHVHIPKIEKWKTRSDGSWQTTEIRCGTTTQRDSPPTSWEMTEDEGQRRFYPNTLIVHRVYLDDTRTTMLWEATTELRTKAGFIAHPSVPRWTAEVWPSGAPLDVPHDATTPSIIR